MMVNQSGLGFSLNKVFALPYLAILQNKGFTRYGQ
jgi:hypothetical protein